MKLDCFLKVKDLSITTKPYKNPIITIAFILMLVLPPTMAIIPNAATAVAVCLLLIGYWLHISNLKPTLNKQEKIILVGLMLAFFLYFLSYLYSDEMYIGWKKIGKVGGFFFAIPIYMAIRKYHEYLLYPFKIGLIIAGPILLLYLMLSGEIREGMGAYHSIIYGSFAMLIFGTSLLISLLLERNIFFKVALGVSGLMCLGSSIMVGARGSWLALPIFIILCIWVALKYKRSRKSLFIFSGIIIFTISAVLISNPTVTKRFQEAVTQSLGYFDNKSEFVKTSTGARLGLWEISVSLWKKHPLIGTGIGDYKIDKNTFIKNNPEYKGLEIYGSAHSNFFEWLVDFGIIGFILLFFFIYLSPLIYFIKRESKADNSGIGIIGVWVVSSNMIFGLTETTMGRSAPVSVFLLFTLIILALSFKDDLVTHENL